MLYNSSITLTSSRSLIGYIRETRGICMREKLKLFPLETKIFISILSAAILLSVVLIIENVMIDYPMVANVKWFVMISLCSVALYFILQDKYVSIMERAVFFVTIVGLLPLGWMNTSIRNPFTIGYSFLILIASVFLFKGGWQWFFICIELVVVLLMLTLTYLHPEYFAVVDSNTEMKDVFFQIPITFFGAIMLLRAFSSAYHSTVNKLKEQKDTLTYITLHDELTGIYNRRHIFQLLEHIEQHFDRYGKIVIGMIDLDDFKSVNDTFGHVAGDELLKESAATIEEIIGDKGIVGRYGGDEFIIVMDQLGDIPYKSILSQLHRMSDVMEKNQGATSFSGGFIVIQELQSLEKCLAQADELLYHSKSRGKNRIFVKEYYQGTTVMSEIN